MVCGTVDHRRASWLRLGPEGGLPVVVLHGAGLDRAGASWCRILPSLAESWPVYAPDLPGHGGTAPLPAFLGVPEMARWVGCFMDSVGIGRAAVAGVSMGGAVALCLGLDQPQRIAGVVPVASYGIARRAPLHGLLHAGTRLPLASLTDGLIARSPAAARIALRAIVHDPASISADMVTELCAIAAQTSAERTFDRFLSAEIRPDGFKTLLVDDLTRLEPPAHFIHGVHDTAVPVAAAREAARIAGAPLTEVDAGHWPMFEAPAICLSAMGSFLEALEP